MDVAWEAVLLDTYGSLLTKNQAEVLHLRLDKDLSLGEIGEILGISRQAVRDAIVKAEQQLERFEEALGLARRDAALRKEIARLEDAWKRQDDISGAITALKELTEE